MLTKLRSILLKIAYPITTTIGKIQFPKSMLRSSFYYTTLNEITPGDVFVTRSEWNLANLFIPGFWGHAAIYVGLNDKGEPGVIEAIGEGVTRTDLFHFLSRKDDACLLRPLFATTMQRKKAAAIAETLEHKKYDWEFRSGNDAFYCSEIIGYCYNQVLKVNPFELRETLGESTVTPEDIYKAESKFTKLAESKV